MIVVDASAVIDTLLGVPGAGRLFDPGQTLYAPHLLDLDRGGAGDPPLRH